MAPGHQHPHQTFSDLPLGKEHLESLMPEDLLEILAHDDGSNLESSCAQKTIDLKGGDDYLFIEGI